MCGALSSILMLQMIANTYSMQSPSFYTMKPPVKKGSPKPTGIMSMPDLGAAILLLSFIMLITLDGFLGNLRFIYPSIAYISLSVVSHCDRTGLPFSCYLWAIFRLGSGVWSHSQEIRSWSSFRVKPWESNRRERIFDRIWWHSWTHRPISRQDIASIDIFTYCSTCMYVILIMM